MGRVVSQPNMAAICTGSSAARLSQVSSSTHGGLTFALQALLTRHESYISESQAEHARLSSYISELEVERRTLQTANEKIVAENRDLLSQLETLNASLITSDDHVKRLEALLLDCELEVKRLNGFVRKTQELDGRLKELEQERSLLRDQIDDGDAETRNTLSRWKDSQRRVRELEEDVLKIENEARLDRKKYEDIIAKLEKDQAIQRELGGAEGRLKGAAAIQGLKGNAPGSKNVVSHFVKDILQDNANLQAGIMELRELLNSSNEEVQNLREQVLLHQPIPEEEGGDRTLQSISLEDQTISLQQPSKQVQQEVHVHHHYHAKLAKKDKPSSVRRPSRRTAVMPTYGYSSGTTTPSMSTVQPYRSISNSSVPLSFPQPQAAKNRWSVQSTATNSTMFSSVPSSPRSYFDRGGSIFDRLEQAEDSSRPTSPESVGDLISPSWKRPLSKFDDSDLTPFEEEPAEMTDAQFLEDEQEDEQEDQDDDYVPQDLTLVEQKHPEQDLTPKPSIILHPSTDDPDRTDLPASQNQTPTNINNKPDTDRNEMLIQDILLNSAYDLHQPLRRRKSHESLVSISGMDIHLAQRGSPTSSLQLLRGNSAHFAHKPSQVRTVSATQPVASVTEYSVLSAGFESIATSDRSVRRMPSGIEALSGIAVPATRSSKADVQYGGGLGRLVGGWVRGKWGMAPVKSVADLRSSSTEQVRGEHRVRVLPGSDEISRLGRPAIVGSASTMSVSSGGSASTKSSTIPQPNDSSLLAVPASNSNLDMFFAGRSPGINQPGMIPGFRAAVLNKRTPSDIQAKVIDEEGLQEGLREALAE